MLFILRPVAAGPPLKEEGGERAAVASSSSFACAAVSVRSREEPPKKRKVEPARGRVAGAAAGSGFAQGDVLRRSREPKVLLRLHSAQKAGGGPVSPPPRLRHC